MPTPSEIDKQIALERQQISQGLQQLHSNTAKLEDKDYASASVYGVASIEQLLPDVVSRIKTTTNRIKEGKLGVAFKEINQYLSGLEAEAAAAISCTGGST